MNRIQQGVAALIVAMGFAFTPAGASDLTADAATRFVDSLPATVALGEALRAEGYDEAFDSDDFDFKPGEAFRPYSGSMNKFKTEFPQAYQRVNGLARDYDFSDGMAWARTGDQVILAYLAARIPPGSLDMMKNLTTGPMADMLPPEAKAQLGQSMAMFEAVEAVSAADKAVIEPLIPRIEQVMGDTLAKYDPDAAAVFQGR